jgi:hypothetical protein
MAGGKHWGGMEEGGTERSQEGIWPTVEGRREMNSKEGKEGLNGRRRGRKKDTREGKRMDGWMMIGNGARAKGWGALQVGDSRTKQKQWGRRLAGMNCK